MTEDKLGQKPNKSQVKVKKRSNWFSVQKYFTLGGIVRHR